MSLEGPTGMGHLKDSLSYSAAPLMEFFKTVGVVTPCNFLQIYLALLLPFLLSKFRMCEVRNLSK